MLTLPTVPVFKTDKLNLSWHTLEMLQTLYGHKLTIKVCLDGVDDCILIYSEDQETEFRLREHMRHCLPDTPLTHASLLRL
jgi:hypothetical protein